MNAKNGVSPGVICTLVGALTTTVGHYAEVGGWIRYLPHHRYHSWRFPGVMRWR